jgi:hypothetical protein
VLAPYLRDPAIAYGGLVVLIGLLLWWAPTPATRDPWLALILVALLVLGTEALRRLAAREHPDAVRDGHAMDRARDGVGRAAGWLRRGDGAGSAVVVRHGAEDTAADDRIEQLERLARLRDAGVLDADEFTAQKREILAGAAQPEPAPNGGPSTAVEPS